MLNRLFLAGAAALATSAVGCGGEDGVPPVSATLADGSLVEVASDGSVSVTVDGRLVFGTAPGRGLTARRFEESYSGVAAIWEFERFSEEVFPIDQYRGGNAGASVTARFESASGAFAELEVSPEPELTATRIRWTVGGLGEVSSLAVPVACDGAASFYGFGEQYNAGDQRGEAFELFVTEQGIGRDPAGPTGGINGNEHTTYFPMPYWLDRRGHGVLFETDHRVLVDLCASDAGVAWVEVVTDAPLDILVFHGPTPLDVIEQLSRVVGRPTAPPSWAYELWIGSQGGRDAVLAEVDALEAASIPVGAFWVQDWTGPRPNFDGGFGVQYRWRPDDEHYPDLAGMIGELHDRGYRFLGYANPFIDPNLEHFPEMEAADLLIRNPSGDVYEHIAPNGSSSHPDLTQEEAREYVRSHLRAMVDELGMDGWMSDFGEWIPLDAVVADGSHPIAYHQTFPIAWHALWREVMDELRPDGDFAVFARSGWTGVQSVSQIHWVGDQEANWSEHDGLPTVVPAMLNLGISGVPFVTHDIAGFSGGPSSKELWLRWVELGAFTPIMRTHEGNDKENNWSWEKDVESSEHLRRMALVHQALAPDFEALAEEASDTSAPVLRHLVLVYPDDPESAGIDDQYLIGEQLLVAPVVTEGATEREVYLPAGEWFHVWTGEAYAGGQRVTVAAPIGQPPVFSRDRDRSDLRAIQ